VQIKQQIRVPAKYRFYHNPLGLQVPRGNIDGSGALARVQAETRGASGSNRVFASLMRAHCEVKLAPKHSAHGRYR